MWLYNCSSNYNLAHADKLRYTIYTSFHTEPTKANVVLLFKIMSIVVSGVALSVLCFTTAYNITQAILQQLKKIQNKKMKVPKVSGYKKQISKTKSHNLLHW